MKKRVFWRTDGWSNGYYDVWNYYVSAEAEAPAELKGRGLCIYCSQP